MPGCHRRADCRLCASASLESVLRLPDTPPANAFIPSSALGTVQAVFPLELFLCRDCGHVQLLDVVDAESLFRDYVYVSGTAPSFVAHFRDYADALVARSGGRESGRVLDVGSNDGTLLEHFRARGWEVLGVDPARSIAAAASSRGVETLPEFFGLELARRLKSERGAFDIITANNVFAHVDDLAGVAAGVSHLLAPEGLFAFEVSWLADVVRNGLFDTIYHEHLAYHATGPLIPFLRRHGLELVAAERVATHGGSLRGVAARAGTSRAVEASVAQRLREETEAGVSSPDTFRHLGARIEMLGEDLRQLLAGLEAKGLRVAGYGAPAKATTLMYTLGLDADTLRWIADDSPWKQGLYTPGLHVPVVAPAMLQEDPPDVLLILAWNFAEPIMRRLEGFITAGGRFLVPLPEPRFHPAT